MFGNEPETQAALTTLAQALDRLAAERESERP
jgi:hypothetical protein